VVRDLGEYQGSAYLRIEAPSISSPLHCLSCGRRAGRIGSYASIEAGARLLPRFIWVIRNRPENIIDDGRIASAIPRNALLRSVSFGDESGGKERERRDSNPRPPA
jgi:hypothetical protein